MDAHQVNSVPVENAPFGLIEKREFVKLFNGQTERICVLHDQVDLIFWHWG